MTSKESFLETYRSKVVSSPQKEIIVGDLTVDHPDLQRRIPDLERLAARKIHLAQSVLDVRQRRWRWCNNTGREIPAQRCGLLPVLAFLKT